MFCVLNLNVGFNRKAGEANYGSRGASVNLELELDSGLAGDPERLAAIRAKLASVADTPLFDTDTFARGIEAAYATMMKTWQSGAPPRGFTVESP